MVSYSGPPTWELQPGSDTPGDRVSPFTSIGTTSIIEVCLVQLSAPFPVEDSEYWSLAPADTPWVRSALGAVDVLEEGMAAPGIYLALRGGGDHHPLPDAWTPVEGPKYFSSPDGSYGYFAGRVHADGTALPPGSADSYVQMIAASNALIFDSMDLLPAVYTAGGSSGRDDVPPAGDYIMLWAFPAGEQVHPGAWPTGFTPLTSVTGPIAITDENAGGVIGDIAYVVSGYVYNSGVATAAALDVPYTVIPTGATVQIEAGDYFVLEESMFSGLYQATETDGFYYQGLSGYNLGEYVERTLAYWPYLERYDLAAKKWLPRIKLPEVDDGVRDYGYEPPSAGSTPEFSISRAGPFALPGGTLDAPPLPEGVNEAGRYLYPASDFTSYVGRSRNLAAGGEFPESYPAGTYWIETQIILPDGIAPPAEDAQALGDALGSRVLDYQGSAKFYASEGGFAGVINGKLYFGGGDGDSITGNEFFSYDPATQTFERLDDVPNPVGATLDYSPFGVVAGKLYGRLYKDAGVGTWAKFDPASGWSTVEVAVDNGPMDQVAGVEIAGKLYFVYDRVYVFDPVALTVEAKAETPTSIAGLVPALAVAVGGTIEVLAGYAEPFAASYDVASDTWTEKPALSPVGGNYSTAVVHGGVPYLLAGEVVAGQNVFGVYGLTGNLATYTVPGVPKALTHLGFSPRMAAVLQADPVAVPFKKLLEAGFSPRQVRTLKRGVFTLKALIRGGFDRHQANALRRD